MRRKITFLITLWWVILCGASGVCLLLFANPAPVVSQEENRTLSAMPQFTLESIRNGNIGESFESFLTDKFFLRSEVVNGASSLKHLFSALTMDEILSGEGEEAFAPEIIMPDEQVEPETTPPDTVVAANEPSPGELPEQTVSYAAGDSIDVWLNNRDGTSTALFAYSPEDIRKAADTLNAYAALLPEGGTLHVLLAPRAQTANKLALHLDTESGWTSETEAALRALAADNITVHSAYDIFQQPILNGEYVYFRTDHHWTARGASLAAESMLKDAGYQTIPLQDYAVKTTEGFLGSIYLHGRNAKLKELADEIEVFYPLLPAESFRVSNAYQKNELPVIDETKENYLVFLGGTFGPYRFLDGGYHTGRNMLLICDSFGNSIAPFFMPYYDKVYMVDFREEYYSKEDAQGGVRKYVLRCDIDDIYVILSDTNGIGSVYLNRLMPENVE
jgi:hypothetical protein